MAERWVSKIEATSLFKVTERTLDNWVKAGRIQKGRHKGQIMYEISQMAEERASYEAPSENLPPLSETTKPEAGTEEEEVSANEMVFAARLEEKASQIAMLMETLEKRQKDLNTLVMERGSLSEKSTLLLNETESLRKEREVLRKEKETLSETSFRKQTVYFFFFTLFSCILLVSTSLFWKYFDEKKIYEESLKQYSQRENEKTEELKKISENKNKQEAEIQSLKTKVSEEILKSSVAIQKASEVSERLSEVQKERENLLKIYNEQQKENQDLKLKVKINELLEANEQNKLKTPKEKESKDKTSHKAPIEVAPEKVIEKTIE